MTTPQNPNSRLNTALRQACAAGAMLGALLGGAPAMASTNGTLGSTSTGSVTITATVANRAQITGLSDVAFTNVDPSATASQSQSNCVWSNTATKGYSITATGNGTNGAFTLANGALSVPYTVQWSGSTGQTSGTSLAAGTALTGLTSTAVNPTCSTSPSTTSSLVISIAAANLQNMVSSTSYTGSLTLLVTPQ